MTNTDLAKVRAALEISHRFFQLLEREHPVRDGNQLVLRDGPQHGFEAVAVAHRDPLQPHLARDDESERRRQHAAGEYADHRQRAAGPDAAQRLRHRPFAAEFQDVVVAAAGSDVARCFVPLWSLQVVDRCVGAERLRPGDFFVA